MSDEKEEPKVYEGTISVGQSNGHVLLILQGLKASAVMNPAQAMELANSILRLAISIDGDQVNMQLQTDSQMLSTYAGLLFGAAGMYLTRRSPIGLADHNESLGLATRLLCQHAETAVAQGKRRTNQKGSNDEQAK